MRPLPLVPALLAATPAATPAAAHPGHLAGLAGHDHWVAGAAIGIAIALGLWGALKDRGRAAEDDRDAADAEPEEAEA